MPDSLPFVLQDAQWRAICLLKQSEAFGGVMVGAQVAQSAFADTIESILEYVLNCFVGHKANAIAEGTNAKIQIASIKNRGARDIDFFFFRLAHFLNPVTSF